MSSPCAIRRVLVIIALTPLLFIAAGAVASEFSAEITVTGQGVASPGNFRVCLGTAASELIAAAGGYRDDVGPWRAYLPLLDDRTPS